jgi:hypothetical protein
VTFIIGSGGWSSFSGSTVSPVAILADNSARTVANCTGSRSTQQFSEIGLVVQRHEFAEAIAQALGGLLAARHASPFTLPLLLRCDRVGAAPLAARFMAHFASRSAP